MGFAMALSGCSITTPIASLLDDDEVSTGSLKNPAATSLADMLTAEDWRRARAALAVALDPEGNGSPVRWDNPETKASGSFAASGPFVVKSHFVCRPFTASLTVKAVQTAPNGLACRQGPGNWVIDERANERTTGAASPSAPPTDAPQKTAPARAAGRTIPRAGSLF